MLNRDEAVRLWRTYNQDDSLFRHALSVEAALRRFAVRYGQDPDVTDALDLAVAEAHAAPALSLAVPEQEQQEEGPWDPFGGPYAEEEIVLDRFANYDDALFRTLPQVASPEGRQLGCLLQSSVGSLTGPHLVLTAPPEPEESVLPQIVVEDDPSGEYSGCGWGRTEGVQRVEYTELFSRLRG